MITSKDIMEALEDVLSPIHEDEGISIGAIGSLAVLTRNNNMINARVGDKSYQFMITKDPEGKEVCDLLGRIMPIEGNPNKEISLSLIDPVGLKVRITDDSIFTSATEMAASTSRGSNRGFDSDRIGGQFVDDYSLPRFTEPDMPAGSQLNRKVAYVKDNSLFGPHAPEFS
jgi:hypothetical protein